MFSSIMTAMAAPGILVAAKRPVLHPQQGAQHLDQQVQQAPLLLRHRPPPPLHR